MVRAATLEVEIGAKIDQFEKSLGKVRKDLKGMETRLGGVSRGASKATSAFSGMAKRLIAVGIAYFGARGIFRMAKSFLDVATSVETYKLRLEAMLGSQEAATEAMAFFKEVAAKVPFTLEEVIEAGVKVQAFGADLKAWTPIMADLAAYMGVTLPEAAGALGRAFAGGAGAADIFRERGILQVIRDFAKMDKGIDDITKISLPEFRDVMFEAFAGAESKVAGTADKLAETWVGVISMLQDKWFKFRDEVMKAKIFELMKKGLASFNEALDKFVKTGGLEEWASNTAIAVITAFEFILGAFKNVVIGFEAFQAALIAIATPFYEMLIDWSEFVLKINEVTQHLGGAFKKEHEDLIERIKNLKESQGKLNAEYDSHIDKIIALTEKFSPWIDKLKEAKEEVEKNKESIGELGEKTKEATEGITESTQVYSKEMVKLITKMIDEVMKLTLNEFEYRKAIALKGYEERKALLEKEKVDKETFALLEKSLAAELEQIEKDKTEAVKEGFKERGEAITAGILAWQELSGEALKGFDAMINGFTDGVMSAFDAFQHLGEFGGNIVTLFETLGKVITGFIAGALNALKQFTMEILLSAAKTIFAKQAEAIAGVIASVMKSVPFPLNLLLVGGAIATVTSLFAGLKPKKMEAGGFVPTETFAHLHAGERVLSAAEVRSGVGRKEGIGMGGRNIVVNPVINIYAQTLDQDTINRAGDEIYIAVERARRRRGHG